VVTLLQRDGDKSYDATYAEGNSGANPGTTGTAGAHATRGTSGAAADLAKPETARPKVGDIPKMLAGLYAMNIAFDCLGFDSKDSELIRGCLTKDPTLVDRISRSGPVNGVLDRWPLRAEEDPAAVRNAVMRALRAGCDLPSEPVAPDCPDAEKPGPVNSTQSRDTVGPALDAAEKAAPGAQQEAERLAAERARAAAPPAERFKQYCSECHAKGSRQLPLSDFHKLKESFKSKICGKLAPKDPDDVMPPSYASKDLPDVERKAMLDSLGCGG
jgi:hypothetical protein